MKDPVNNRKPDKTLLRFVKAASVTYGIQKPTCWLDFVKVLDYLKGWSVLKNTMAGPIGRKSLSLRAE